MTAVISVASGGAIAVESLLLGALIHRGRGGHETRAARTASGHAVFVKMCCADAGEDAAVRLEHEATLLERLAHVTGVVRLVAYERERALLVTERAAGLSLLELRDRKELSRSDAVRVGKRLLGVLRRVHAAGIVHRDVSPGNVIYAPESGGVVLCDLGQALDVRFPTRFECTWRDTEVGTPGFRSPDLVRNAETRTPSVDFSALVALIKWIDEQSTGPSKTHGARWRFIHNHESESRRSLQPPT